MILTDKMFLKFGFMQFLCSIFMQRVCIFPVLCIVFLHIRQGKCRKYAIKLYFLCRKIADIDFFV